MLKFTIRYQAGAYSGTKIVYATDEAKEQVKRMIHKEMSLPMYSESYKVVKVEDPDSED